MELKILKHSEFGKIRTTTDEKGNILFCGSDVAKALGYRNPNKAISDHCRAITKCDSPISGKIQAINFIPEPDLYRLIMKSKLPSAVEFERWVYEKVLPSLRKYGMYAKDEILNDSKLLKTLVEEIKKENTEKNNLSLQNELLEEIVAEYQPKIDYLESILQSDCTMTATQIAADYGISACKLNKILHAERIHRKVGGQWILYLAYMNKGLTNSETSTMSSINRTFSVHTRWTQKGRLLIHQVLTNLGYVSYQDSQSNFYYLP